MPGIHFDYTVNDSPFYASADRIVRRVSDMSKVIDNMGNNISFAPLLNNLEKMMKEMSLSVDIVDGIKEKISVAMTSISNSTDSAEKKQQNFKDAILGAFSMIASSIESELGASKAVLNNFYNELDVVMENIKKNSADVIDVDAIKDKVTSLTRSIAEVANPETESVGVYNIDTGVTEDRLVKVNESIRVLREKAVEDVRAINEELQLLVANIGDGSIDQVQKTLDGLAPLEAQLNTMLNQAQDKQKSAEFDSDEWNEAKQELFVYQKALEQVKGVKEAIANEVPNTAEVDALRQQSIELEDLISREETAIEKLEASKTAIKETMNAVQEIGLSGTPSNVSSGTPQIYLSQEEYENVKQMREEIANLQTQISQFDGSEENLTALKEQLSDMNDKLREAEMTAIDTAAAYGTAEDVVGEFLKRKTKSRPPNAIKRRLR